VAGPDKPRPPAPPPRPEDPEEVAFGEAARARIERYVILVLVAAFATFAWSLLRTPVRAPSPGTEPPTVAPAPER
jgi:hypothetical protein